jgi:diacylglycerol kinase (ATP)
MNPRSRGLRRLLHALNHSWDGFRSAWHHEEAFRQESLLSALLIPLAFWVGDNGVEWALLIASVLLVILTELLNSGIEAIVDRIGAERHELSKRAKDIGSAAVLVALINVSIVWLLLLID